MPNIGILGIVALIIVLIVGVGGMTWWFTRVRTVTSTQARVNEQFSQPKGMHGILPTDPASANRMLLHSSHFRRIPGVEYKDYKIRNPKKHGHGGHGGLKKKQTASP